MEHNIECEPLYSLYMLFHTNDDHSDFTSLFSSLHGFIPEP